MSPTSDDHVRDRPCGETAGRSVGGQDSDLGFVNDFGDHRGALLASTC